MWMRFFVLLCFVGATFAGPLQSDTKTQCTKECRLSPQLYRDWKAGTAYIYNYRSENIITYAGNQSEKTSIEGKVEFHSINNCEAVLKMVDLKIHQKLTEQEIEDFKKHLEIPLLFSWNDETVNYVCPSSQESTHSLNIKKSILSAMVNSVSKLNHSQEVKEHDSLGECHTKYTVTDDNGLVIKKEKDLKSCTNRHTFITSFFRKNFPSYLIFEKEHLVCTQYIENKIMKKVECKEAERIKPPLKGESLVEFSGFLEVDLIEAIPAKEFHHEMPMTQESISYSFEESRMGDGNEKALEDALKKMCGKNLYVVDVSSRSDFLKLVPLVKVLSYQQLDKIYESLKNGKLCSSELLKDFFVDTLSAVGTDATVKLMVKLLLNKDVTGLKAKLLPASLALVQNPSQETVATIIPLLKRDNSASVILGVSSLIHRFCSLKGCDNISSVQEVVSVFNNYLGDKCSSNEKDKVLKACKAFGNMGYHGKARDNIIECIKDRSKSNRLRLAAIDSFRRINKKIPDVLVHMFSNKEEDYEIRIALISSIFKHADEHQIKKLKKTLEKETNEQVSGYVYSYIKNVNNTSFSNKKKLRKLLQDIKIQLPEVKYWETSKNIEMSTYNKLIKIGGGVEADIIHSPNSKIPHSVYTRLDIELFEKKINLLELGFRTEGMDKMVKHLTGLKDKFSKLPSWKSLNLKNVTRDTDFELSLFIRTMETEFFDMSTAGMPGLLKMFKTAIEVNKQHDGKNSESSHSFVFMNTKIVVPSVTGRLYSIDLTGSSTVGLTSRNKFDISSLPQNADINLHLQPRVNVEVSTRVGIQSSNYRPDFKIVSLLYLESNFEVDFKVKDGHIALGRLSVPSENIARVKLISNIVKVDVHHNEKSVFEKLERKYEQCFRKLNTPLGLSVCAYVEYPDEFIQTVYPYVLPYGNVELALKKSDDTLNSYDIYLEIPKNSLQEVFHQQIGNVRYKASFDTPGSKTLRRFAVDLELIKRTSHNELMIQLTSPFRSIGGTGSYSINNNLIQGFLEMHSNSQQLFSFNITNKISSSRSRKVYQASAELSYKKHHPFRIDGSVTVNKGKKHHTSFAFKANRPQFKPVAFKGTIVKEGQIEFSQKSKWKLSFDATLNTPLGDVQIRKTVEKIYKHSEEISLNLEIGYGKKETKKQSVIFLGSIQKSSTKIHTNATFELTQFQQANWYLIWDLQRESKEKMKNRITLKYGRNPELNYIHLEHRSRIPLIGPGICTASLQAPQFNINCDIALKHEFKFDKSPKIFMEVDLCCIEDSHLKGIVDIEYKSKNPLKAFSKLEIEFLDKHYMYEGQIKEKSKNVIEGKSKFQYDKEKYIEFNFEQHRLSDNSRFHHEIESYFLTPTTLSPVKSRGSLQISSESLAIVGEIGSKYSLQALLNQASITYVSLKMPKLDVNLKAIYEDFKRSVDLDFKLKTDRLRHIIALILAETGEKKHFHLEIVPDAAYQPHRKVLLSSILELKKHNSNNTDKSISPSRNYNRMDTEAGYMSHRMHLMSPITNDTIICIIHEAELKEGQSKSTIRFLKNNIEKIKVKFEGNIHNNSNKRVLTAKTFITSPDNSFENMDLHLVHKTSHSGSSKLAQSLMSVKKNKNIFKAEWNSDFQPNGWEMKAKMQTPFVKYKNQAISIFIQHSENGSSSSINIEIPDNEKVSIVTEIENSDNGFSANCNLNSPFDIVRDFQAHLIIEGKSNKKALNAYIDINNARIIDLHTSRTSLSDGIQAEGNLQVSPIPNVEFQGFLWKYQRATNSVSFSGKAELSKNKEILLTSNVIKKSNNIDVTITINTPYKSLKFAEMYISNENHSLQKRLSCRINANGELNGNISISFIPSSKSVEMQSWLKTNYTSEVSVHLKHERSRNFTIITTSILKDATPILSTSLLYKDGEKVLLKTKSLNSNVLDMEISKDLSEGGSKKYYLKASGAFSPLSIAISTTHKDKMSVNTEIHICTEFEQNICYTLNYYHENLNNSDNYYFYKKATIELVKSVKGSQEKRLGQIHLQLSKAENNCKSKLTFEANEKVLGYDLILQKDDNGRYSADCKLYHPLRNCWTAVTFLRNDNRMNFEIKSTRDVDLPGTKFSFEIGKEFDPETKEVSGFLKMGHPKMPQPILISCRFQEVEQMLYRAKLLMRYNPTDGKSLMAEMTPEIHRELGMKTITYRLYSEEGMETSVKLVKESSNHENIIGYEWKYSSCTYHKKGVFRITLNENPKSIKISYSSPSANFEIFGKAAQALEPASLSLVSHGRQVRQIHIKTSDTCTGIEVFHSDLFLKSSVCFNQREGRKLHLMKIDLDYRRLKSLDMRIGLDTENYKQINVDMKWDKKNLCKAANELVGRKNISATCSATELKESVKNKLMDFSENSVKPIVEASWNNVKNTTIFNYNKFKTAVLVHSAVLEHDKKVVKNAKESAIFFLQSLISCDPSRVQVLKPLHNIISCILEKQTLSILKYVPEVSRRIWEATKSRLQHCLKTYCTPGTFCYKSLNSHQQYIHLSNIFQQVRSGTYHFKQEVLAVFSKSLSQSSVSVINFFKNIFDKYVGQSIIVPIVNFNKRVIGLVINKINEVLDVEEEYKAAKSLVFNAQEKLVPAWKNKEDIVISSLKPIKSSIEKTARKIIQKQFQMMEYNPKEGIIKFVILQPLEESKFETVKKELQKLGRKF
ncbi:vitellogenin [Caerostris darwini]|uniref:Vitellogenin n=1 Tax=Caerostris darwini TaxID=1538125 RepID=A0AAV4QG53_9ARAC|nr:vitellogenin [Caerostris darwini]